MNITTCPFDPFPTSVLIDSDVWLDWLVHIVNMSLSTDIFPEPLKTAIVKPLLKKPTVAVFKKLTNALPVELTTATVNKYSSVDRSLQIGGQSSNGACGQKTT